MICSVGVVGVNPLVGLQPKICSAVVPVVHYITDATECGYSLLCIMLFFHDVNMVSSLFAGCTLSLRMPSRPTMWMSPSLRLRMPLLRHQSARLMRLLMNKCSGNLSHSYDNRDSSIRTWGIRTCVAWATMSVVRQTSGVG